MNSPLWFCCCCCFCSCCLVSFVVLLLPDFDDEEVLVSAARYPHDWSTCIILGEKCTTFATGLLDTGDCSFTDEDVTRLGDIGVMTTSGFRGGPVTVDGGASFESVDTTSILISSSSWTYTGK